MLSHRTTTSPGSGLRSFLCAATAILVYASAPPVWAAEFQLSQIAPGNFVHFGGFEERSAANLGDNANIGFIVGERCVAVIDSGGSYQLGAALLGALRRVTPLPVCYVITTHVHPDHFFGAAAFRDGNTQFVGHAQLPQAYAARARFYLNTIQRDLGAAAQGSEIVIPTVLVQDELELDLGNRLITLRAWPVAHTDDDLSVFDERTRTLWLGDLLFVRHTPVVDGSITGFIDVLEKLRTIPAVHYVPGHGRPQLPWPQALDAQTVYLKLIADETRRAIKQRMTIQEAVDTVGHSQSANWVNFDLYHRRNVSTAYTELEWED